MTDKHDKDAVTSADEAPSEMDPPGGHSRAALEDAEEKMHAKKQTEGRARPRSARWA
jgi:hypothetical protein